MGPLKLSIRNATTFTPDGALDEEAQRAFLQRFVDVGCGYLLGSGGTGEGHALNGEELSALYRAGVEVSRGRVEVGSNQPETPTARRAIEHAAIAVEAEVDVINLYGPACWHGYVPTDDEYTAYLAEVLAEVRHPVTLSPNRGLGYCPPPRVLAGVANRFTQVVSVNLSGVPDDRYYVDLRDELHREVEVYVNFTGSPQMFALGATGMLAADGHAEGNLIPRTFRRYVDLYSAGDFQELSRTYADVRRLSRFVAGWGGGPARWVKLAMRGFKLPGGEGGSRAPYLRPPDEEVVRFVRGAIALGIPEILELAHAADIFSVS
jgi:4-hydroxy-tetrahydrodipicolinate synthase